MLGLQTVVELPAFVRQAKTIMSEDERGALVDFIAANPQAGVSFGGGLRKVRFAREGSGKRGGYRTIFVFGGTHMPIFLVGVFAKNEKENLNKAQLAALLDLSQILISHGGQQ